MPRAFGAARTLLAAALLAVLAACSERPYPVAPLDTEAAALAPVQKAARAAGRPEPWLFGICYSRALNSPEEVREEARFACPEGELTLRANESLWTPCALLQPARATFLCTPRPEAE